jgi:hypothetical protein
MARDALDAELSWTTAGNLRIALHRTSPWLHTAKLTFRSRGYLSQKVRTSKLRNSLNPNLCVFATLREIFVPLCFVFLVSLW